MDTEFTANEGDLSSWRRLNEALRVADEKGCNALMTMELKGAARLRFLFRIYGAMSERRYERERRELAAKAKEN